MIDRCVCIEVDGYSSAQIVGCGSYGDILFGEVYAVGKQFFVYRGEMLLGFSF